jgi:endonuclease-3 related protein
MKASLLSIYYALLGHFGSQHWWPAESRFEVIIGAILTQNTAWQNVERVIENLKKEGILTPEGIFHAPEEKLQTLLKPAGYFRIKTKRLKHFINFLFEEHSGNLTSLRGLPKDRLREQLLNVNGIGPETADSIVLYATDKLSFVVDAYTKRIFSRLGVIETNTSYAGIKEYFEKNLPRDLKIYKEFHALIVKLGKIYCKAKPLCNDCPIRTYCSYNNVFNH